MKIAIDRDIPFLRGVFEPFARTEYFGGSEMSREDIRDADALIVRTRTKCDAGLLDGSSVRFIATATIGTDHIDLDYCRAHGICIANAAGCNARGVLQWVGAVLVHLLHRRNMRPEELTLGIVGVGHVGGLVAEYAERWGFRTVCCDPPREEREHLGFRTLEEVFAVADIITLHTPLDESTRHMVGSRLFAETGRYPFVINASRGEVVDTEALLVSGAEFAADVWEHEPDIDLRMLQRALLATPHIAGYSLQGKANAAAMAVAAVAEFFSLPIAGWYPEGVARSVPRPIGWNELCATIGDRYDIAAESGRLKSHPEDFERLRNSYAYREEYF